MGSHTRNKGLTPDFIAENCNFRTHTGASFDHEQLLERLLEGKRVSAAQQQRVRASMVPMVYELEKTERLLRCPGLRAGDQRTRLDEGPEPLKRVKSRSIGLASLPP